MRKVKGPPEKPLALKPGDTVGVVAPAAAVERQFVERGLGLLRSIGFRVRVSNRVLNRDGILAGGDRERAEDLMAFFADPDVRAIFVARGGYGCGRILPLLDFDAIALTPKPLIGFSDLTFILNALIERSAMVAIHGPMLAFEHEIQERHRRSFEHLRKILTGELGAFEMEARTALHPGRAEGELMGGCLSIVAAMLGTPYCPSFDDRILFLEDVGERAYRIDRLLVQLRHSGAFDRCAGVVFGAVRSVDGDENEAQLIARFAAEQTAGFDCPVLFGVDAGHGTDNLALPLGVRARIDSASRRLTILEPAVI